MELNTSGAISKASCSLGRLADINGPHRTKQRLQTKQRFQEPQTVFSELATNQPSLNDDPSLGPVVSALRYSGTAMIQSSMILGLSIVLYAFCGLLPTVRFGILLSAMMLAALIGDLLLPALLAVQKQNRNDRQTALENSQLPRSAMLGHTNRQANF